MNMNVSKILIPPKFKYFHKKNRKMSIKILDVGCANNSPAITKHWFPNSTYHGVDKYFNETQDQFIDNAIKIDLENDNLKEHVRDNYDIIILSHVIEHLENGKEIIDYFCGKLNSPGHIYIEFPSKRSLELPSAIGTLNFYDDPTHKKMYYVDEIKEILLKNDISVIKYGSRRDLKRIIFTSIPSMIINLFRIIRGKKIIAKGLWDLLGFADFVYGER